MLTFITWGAECLIKRVPYTVNSIEYTEINYASLYVVTLIHYEGVYNNHFVYSK